MMRRRVRLARPLELPPLRRRDAGSAWVLICCVACALALAALSKLVGR